MNRKASNRVSWKGLNMNRIASNRVSWKGWNMNMKSVGIVCREKD